MKQATAVSGGWKVLNLTKTQSILAILAIILGWGVSSLGAYYKAVAAAKADTTAVELKLVEHYVKKDDFKELNNKMGQVLSELGEIKGRLPVRNR